MKQVKVQRAGEGHSWPCPVQGAQGFPGDWEQGWGMNQREGIAGSSQFRGPRISLGCKYGNSGLDTEHRMDGNSSAGPGLGKAAEHTVCSHVYLKAGRVRLCILWVTP